MPRHLLWPESPELRQVFRQTLEDVSPRGAAQNDTAPSEAQPLPPPVTLGSLRRSFARCKSLFVCLIVALVVSPGAAQITRVTFEEAIRLALEKNPDVVEAAQAILRAEALLQQARTVERPT